MAHTVLISPVLMSMSQTVRSSPGVSLWVSFSSGEFYMNEVHTMSFRISIRSFPCNFLYVKGQNLILDTVGAPMNDSKG